MGRTSHGCLQHTHLCSSLSCGPFMSSQPHTLVSPLIIAAVPGATWGGAGGRGTGLFQKARLAMATSWVWRSKPCEGRRGKWEGRERKE